MTEIAVFLLTAGNGALPEGSVIGARRLHGQDQRQGGLALSEIITGILAYIGRRAIIIEYIILNLEGETEVNALVAQGRDLLFRRAGSDRAALRSRREQGRRLG